jgi:hypothetical protein
MRSFRGPWLWLGGLFLALVPFLAAIAIAYFLKDLRYSLFWNFWMLAAWVSFVVAFACFFGAVAGWPFPPWVRPGFPDIRVQIYGAGLMDTEREAGTGIDVPARLRSFHARFVNSEAEQHASLTVLLYVKLIPGSWGRLGEAVCPQPDWPLPPSLGLSPISMPFALPPGEAIDGHLVYEMPGYYLDKIAEPMNARLELLDHVTGKRMSLRAEIGEYDKSQMTASSGGAEMLGPEYEDKTADAGPDPARRPAAPAEPG